MQTRTSIAFGEMKAKEYDSLIKNAQTRAQIALEQANRWVAMPPNWQQGR